VIREVLGSALSVLIDFAVVHLGAAQSARSRADRARTPAERARWHRKAMEQLQKAQAALARAELAELREVQAADAAVRRRAGGAR
jgi:acyl-CoA reductase-like NAD-dependent aldehyde dehydrogenase